VNIIMNIIIIILFNIIRELLLFLYQVVLKEY